MAHSLEGLHGQELGRDSPEAYSAFELSPLAGLRCGEILTAGYPRRQRPARRSSRGGGV